MGELARGGSVALVVGISDRGQVSDNMQHVTQRKNERKHVTLLFNFYNTIFTKNVGQSFIVLQSEKATGLA